MSGRSREPLFATPCCNTLRATWSAPSEPPQKKPFFEVLWFSALVQAAVVNLFVLNLACFISVCPCIPETGRLESTYSCCGFWLWSWVVAAVNLFVLGTEKKQKRPCPAVQGTWLHVGPFLAGVLTQRFSTQSLELYIPRLARCTSQWVVSCSGYIYVGESLKTPVPVYTRTTHKYYGNIMDTDLNVETNWEHYGCRNKISEALHGIK